MTRTGLTGGKSKGFTLIELLVVIAIIGLLSSIVLTSLNKAKMKGRDARRIIDMRQLELALRLYYEENKVYPSVAESGNNPGLAGWRVSFIPNFMAALVPKYLPVPPVDPINSGPPDSMFSPRPDGTFFYMYYNYGSGAAYGCPWNGPFSVVGFRALESVGKTNLPKAQCGPQTPPCPDGGISGVCRDWSSEFDYSVFLVQ